MNPICVCLRSPRTRALIEKFLRVSQLPQKSESSQTSLFTIINIDTIFNQLSIVYSLNHYHHYFSVSNMNIFDILTRLGAFFWSIIKYIVNNFSTLNHFVFNVGIVLMVFSVVLGLLTGDPAYVERVWDAIKFLEGLVQAAEGLQVLQRQPPAPAAAVALAP